MIKRTLYFGNPAELRVKNKQLRIIQEKGEKTTPIEDIGVVVLDHYGVTISYSALKELADNNTSIITTNDSHMPAAMMLNLNGHSGQGETFRAQLSVSEPLKKQLWKQTIQAKLKNQLLLLKQLGLPEKHIQNLVNKVQSGDAGNLEAQAARYYWNNLFDPVQFKRYRQGKPPNNLLNYGYAILRAVISRSLSGSGLLPVIGIHHKSKYNPFPLADDIMEPYRPFVDEIVWNLAMNEYDITILTTDIKRELLTIPNLPVMMKNETRPLMIAASHTTASLQKCFTREAKTILFPKLCG